MNTFRDAVLEGTLEAAQIHEDLATHSRWMAGCDAVDVFRLIDERNILLLFQKLGGLLGAYMNYQRAGILVTTERSLSIQRFTAAHELGHAVLNHSVAIDSSSMLTRTPFGRGRYDAKEMAADAFASMLLMPESLINAVAARQRWGREAIRRPEVVYQMCLRLGVSYEALTRTLTRHGILDLEESGAILKVPVKQLKQRALDGTAHPPDWRCNVWELTDRDMDCTLTAEPADYFVVRLREMSGAGYLWNIDQVREAGFRVVSDQRRISLADDIGSDGERVFTAQPVGSQSSSLTAVQLRPWDSGDVAGRFRIRLEVYKPGIGFTPRHRMEALAA